MPRLMLRLMQNLPAVVVVQMVNLLPALMMRAIMRAMTGDDAAKPAASAVETLSPAQLAEAVQDKAAAS